MCPKISVIIPVFNVENYIERCVISLMKQTYSDLEFIFVDDCSTDTSISHLTRVIQDFPKRLDCIKIIRLTKNGGPSVARNAGINAATGDFVAFCDADDWIEPDMYEKLVEAAANQNADVVLSDIYLENKSGQEYFRVPRHCEDIVTFLKKHFTSEWTPVYNMIVSKELLTSSSLLFPEHIFFCEDFHFTTKLFFFAKNIRNLDAAFYHYDRTRCSSIVHAQSEEKKYVERQCYLETVLFLKSTGLEDELQREISWRILVNKKHMIYSPERHPEFLEIYPESAHYIWSCPYIHVPMKILMWALTHHLRFITVAIVKSWKIVSGRQEA